jgi:hypothetical protein
VIVQTDQLFSYAYTSALGSYSGSTSGNVVLDDQGFFFNSGISLSTLGAGFNPLNTYLVSIQIKEPSVTSGSGLALSAITVDTVPEPATVFMLVTGLGVFGLVRLRRSKA